MRELKPHRGTTFGGSFEERGFYGAQQGLGRNVAFSPDGKILAAIQDQTVRCWDLTTGEEIDRPLKNTAMQCLALAPDGKRVAVGVGTQVLYWDALDKPSRIFSLEGSATTWESSTCSVALSADGKFVAAGFKSGDVAVWNRDGKRLWQDCRHKGKVSTLAFSEDGQAILSAGPDCRLVWQEPATGRELRTLEALEQKSAPLPRPARRSYEGEPALSLAGERLLTVNRGNTELWELASGQRRCTIPFAEAQDVPGGYGPAGTISADGRVLARNLNGRIQLVDTGSGKTLRWVVDESGIHAVALSSNGRLLATAAGTGARLWDTASGTLVADLTGRRGPFQFVALSADGSTVATGGVDSTIQVWNVPALLGKVAPPEPTAHELAELWQQLAAEDAAEAQRAARRLRQHPARAVALLRQKLRPVPVPEKARLDRLFADLDSDAFPVRQRAHEELEQLGGLVETRVRRLLEGNPAADLRKQLQSLLESLEGLVTQRERIRALRAVELLEQLRLAESRALLRELAQGASGAELTEEARACLLRLGGTK